jgi:hypothetical protein
MGLFPTIARWLLMSSRTPSKGPGGHPAGTPHHATRSPQEVVSQQIVHLQLDLPIAGQQMEQAPDQDTARKQAPPRRRDGAELRKTQRRLLESLRKYYERVCKATPPRTKLILRHLQTDLVAVWPRSCKLIVTRPETRHFTRPFSPFMPCGESGASGHAVWPVVTGATCYGSASPSRFVRGVPAAPSTAGKPARPVGRPVPGQPPVSDPSRSAQSGPRLAALIRRSAS